MQFQIDDITARIVKPTRESTPQEDSLRFVEFVNCLTEINKRLYLQNLNTSLKS